MGDIIVRKTHKEHGAIIIDVNAITPEQALEAAKVLKKFDTTGSNFNIENKNKPAVK